MNETNPNRNEPGGLSPHRIDALTDGIYAVAMTLLVIELKLPEHGVIHSYAEFTHAVFELWPRFYAWVISFFVMAFFWVGHHRAHNHLRRVDGKLIVLNLCQLAFISLMPFSSSVLGAEHAGFLAQAIFAGNMTMLAVFALLTSGYVYRHPELSAAPMPRGSYLGARIRIGGLIVISALTVLIQSFVEGGGAGFGNIAFMLMAVIVPLSRRAERASGPAAPRPAPG
ncbi:MAG: TMEM175 family protein [Burkholderiales bacterium]